jgi:hypothetical protein
VSTSHRACWYKPWVSDKNTICSIFGSNKLPYIVAHACLCQSIMVLTHLGPE